MGLQAQRWCAQLAPEGRAARVAHCTWCARRNEEPPTALDRTTAPPPLQYLNLSFLGIFTFTAPYLPWVLLAFSLMLGNSPVVDLLGMAAGGWGGWARGSLRQKGGAGWQWCVDPLVVAGSAGEVLGSLGRRCWRGR